MFHLQKATQITSGDADDPATLRRLAALYRYPERPASAPCLGRPYIRANVIGSIDGAVTHDGKSGDLGGPGDKAVYRTLRGLADVVLVGARTALVEGYRQPAADDVFADPRGRAGQRRAPALALTSRTLDIPVDYPPLTSDQTVVLTCLTAPADRRAALVDAGATVVDCGTDTVEMEDIADYCVEREWRQVLCEGGPRVLGSLIAADLVDDLCLTVSPNLAGGHAGRIAEGTAGALRGMRLETLLTDDDGFVFTRWTRSV